LEVFDSQLFDELDGVLSVDTGFFGLRSATNYMPETNYMPVCTIEAEESEVSTHSPDWEERMEWSHCRKSDDRTPSDDRHTVTSPVRTDTENPDKADIRFQLEGLKASIWDTLRAIISFERQSVQMFFSPKNAVTDFKKKVKELWTIPERMYHLLINGAHESISQITWPNLTSVTFIEHFPSGGFDNTSYPPAGSSSPNITSTLPLNPSVLLTGFLVFYKCPSVS
jgi:hypothetical protein